MSNFQLQNVDFIAKGLKCEKTFLMKVQVKDIQNKPFRAV